MRNHAASSILSNSVLIAALASMVSSQLFKVFLPLAGGRAPDFRRVADYGGFPSAHSAFISACAFSIGLTEGFSSGLFALAVVCAAIIISDILRLRRTVEQSRIDIARLLEKVELPGPERATQFRSHTPVEVVAGVVWGCVCAYLVWL
ncbi:MAG: divergent PAP2 family protein [Rectinemataceae bacterium]